MAAQPHHDHVHHRRPAAQKRAFSLAQHGLMLRLGVAAVLIASIWVVLIALVQA